VKYFEVPYFNSSVYLCSGFYNLYMMEYVRLEHLYYVSNHTNLHYILSKINLN